MIKIALAALVLAMAALAPAAAMKGSGGGEAAAPSSQSPCECCGEGQIDALRACAAFCQSALPSAVDAVRPVFLFRHAVFVIKIDGVGLTLEPPAPPPRPLSA